MLKRIHPKALMAVIDEIDNAPESYTLSRKDATRRVFSVLACVGICLLLIHYLKYFNAFKASLYFLGNITTDSPSHYYDILVQNGFIRLAGYAWWTGWHVIGYLVLPYFFIKKILGLSIRDMGWRWNDTGAHSKDYVYLLSPILFFIVLVSFRSDFLNHYPFYKQSSRSWFDFASWEILYLTQFICLEFFFRGFFVNALRPAIGVNAVWVMCVPYLMIHFPKLWIEATGAILFGFFLGLLALRSRSIWGGFFVHAGIAVSMDLASLIQQGKLPEHLMPFS